MTAANQPLIVPIAHYVGQVYEMADDTTTYDLRGGWDIVSLTEPERAVWTLAHGVPEYINEGKRWTRSALTDAAAPYVGGADPDAIITDLLDRDVLAEFVPGTRQAVDFAAEYRIVPMQLGLGNTKEEPWAWRIGFGDTALVTTSHTVFHTWKWSHLYKNLWESCRKLAQIREEQSSRIIKPEDKDPEAILTQVLENLHLLLVANCAYIDVSFDWGTA